MPVKTFAFEPDSEKVLRALFEAYAATGALLGALRAILDEVPHPTPEELALLRNADIQVLDSIRRAAL